jgi:hypothetical protein
LDGSVIALISDANGTGILNGVVLGMTEQPCGFFGGSIFSGAVAI